jgi:hypothetical protein
MLLTDTQTNWRRHIKQCSYTVYSLKWNPPIAALLHSEQWHHPLCSTVFSPAQPRITRRRADDINCRTAFRSSVLSSALRTLCIKMYSSTCLALSFFPNKTWSSKTVTCPMRVTVQLCHALHEGTQGISGKPTAWCILNYGNGRQNPACRPVTVPTTLPWFVCVCVCVCERIFGLQKITRQGISYLFSSKSTIRVTEVMKMMGGTCSMRWTDKK